jgi:zinc/manganese transport system substrate-binding protein
MTLSRYLQATTHADCPKAVIRRLRYLGKFAGAVALFGVALFPLSGVSVVSATAAKSGVINAIGTENEYANVLSQIGGQYVKVSSILNNPSTDPHTYEVSTTVAQEVQNASLIVQNGVGYDNFMNRMESASPNANRKLIVAQSVLGLPAHTSNPHLWYNPTTMPKVAAAISSDLAKLEPSHRAYFQAKLRVFDSSLKPWLDAIAAFKSKYGGTAVATTEPVADYLLSAMGLVNRTPFVFQADIMNGVDPSPENITLEKGFFTKHTVKVFCYNEQVVSSLTTSIRQTAQSQHVPVVGVYETMPTPGYDYQTWMLAEVNAIKAAIVNKASTQHL